MSLDHDTSVLIDALTYRLRNRDQYPDDPELFAKEFVTALLGHGWRPTEARRVDWHDLPRGSGQPVSEESRRALKELRDKLAGRSE